MTMGKKKNKTEKNSLVLGSSEEVKNLVKNFDLEVIAKKIQNIEKAIYHLSGRQKESIEHQEKVEELLVHIATTLDEMLNGMDVFVNGTSEDHYHESDEELDDQELDDAWESSKKSDISVN